MKGHSRYLIAGGNIAALVAAIELCRRGHSVAVVRPEPRWGGHFSSIPIGGEFFDSGVAFFEFDSFKKQSGDLVSYDSSTHNDSGRFLRLIEPFIRKRVECVEIPPIETYFQGTYGEDLVISNRLELLKGLPAATTEAIHKELDERARQPNAPYHAALKSAQRAAFIEQNFSTVSRRNHGDIFHNLFIEPLFRKILFRSSTEVPALFHRAAWAPLYYPETLLSALSGEAVRLPAARFHYPAKGWLGFFTETLSRELAAFPNFSLIDDSIARLSMGKDIRVVLSGGSEHVADKFIWSMAPADLLKALGEKPDTAFERASMTLAFLMVETAALRPFSAVHVLDEKFAFYRITNQATASRRGDSYSKVVVELNSEYAMDKLGGDRAVKAYLPEALVSMGVLTNTQAIRALEVRAMNHSMLLPTRKNYDLYTRLSDTIIDRCPSVAQIGPAAGFLCSSLNDQIVQGLKIGMFS